MPVYGAKLRTPHPYPRFLQNDGSSTCGFILTNIGMVGDS